MLYVKQKKAQHVMFFEKGETKGLGEEGRAAGE